MKKTIAFILLLALLLGLSSCGSGGNINTNNTNNEINNSTNTNTSGDTNTLAGSYKILVWCPADAVYLTIKQIADFNANNLTDIVPLNADGSPGENNTNGVYGGWFNADNEPRVWNGGHVYIEVYDDLFSWDCGIRNDTCYDDEHTVTMQYQYQVGSTLKKVNVRVHFTINWGW